MHYQDILVHIDDGEAMPGRLGVALDLAQRFRSMNSWSTPWAWAHQTPAPAMTIGFWA